jgi:hypothetical protein
MFSSFLETDTGIDRAFLTRINADEREFMQRVPMNACSNHHAEARIRIDLR